MTTNIIFAHNSCIIMGSILLFNRHLTAKLKQPPVFLIIIILMFSLGISMWWKTVSNLKINYKFWKA